MSRSMREIASLSPTESDGVLNVNDIVIDHQLDKQSISSTNKNNKTYKYIFIVFCLILILLAAAGVFSIISYLVDENIKNCVNENIFNKKSTFINTCMSAIK